MLGSQMAFTFELECEDDGRWLVEILELPGCMAYGSTPEQALLAAQALALRALAYRIDGSEQPDAILSITFVEKRKAD